MTPPSFIAAHRVWRRAQKRATARAKRLGLPGAAHVIAGCDISRQLASGVFAWAWLTPYLAQYATTLRRHAAAPMAGYRPAYDRTARRMTTVAETPAQRRETTRQARWVYTLAADAVEKLHRAALVAMVEAQPREVRPTLVAQASVVHRPAVEQTAIAAAA